MAQGAKALAEAGQDKPFLAMNFSCLLKQKSPARFASGFFILFDMA